MFFNVLVAAAALHKRSLPVLDTNQVFFFLSENATLTEEAPFILGNEVYECQTQIGFTQPPTQFQCFIEKVRADYSYGPGLLKLRRAKRIYKTNTLATEAETNAYIASIGADLSSPIEAYAFNVTYPDLTPEVQRQHRDYSRPENQIVVRSTATNPATRVGCAVYCIYP